ncbi:Phage DNA packaging protein Nu1 [Desulforhopalus singaporensis]|uniref:Phage DNA packaging protein Nu1 n=1 Tax=Desulforhopalus singaporensis TaxID=91360 RepID=A0A1H0VCF2_9BACT|nr:Phage DNA packaging protein Nu1 [Desulforhopalus singaporensis]
MENKVHPKGLLLNRTELSHCFGIAKTTIDSYVRAGMPVYKKGKGKGDPSQYDTAECLNWIRSWRCFCR